MVDRRPRAPRPAAHRGGLPGRRHPELRRHRVDPAPRRHAHRGDAGSATTSPTWPRRRGTTTVRCSRCTPATSGASRCAAPTRRSGRDRGAVDRPRRRVGGARARHAGPPGRRARGRVLRRRRPAPARDRRHAGHAGRPPRARRRPRRRRPGGVHRQPDRRRHRHLRVAVDRRRRSSSSPPTTACTPRSWAATPSSCAASSLDDHAPDGRGGRRADASAGDGRHPARRPRTCTIRHVGERRLATALLLPHDVADDARLPVLSTPTAGRTPSGWCRRDRPT